MEKIALAERCQRRGFLVRLFAAISATTALFLSWRRGNAGDRKPTIPDSGPILYHRTEETERYYRTLYR